MATDIEVLNAVKGLVPVLKGSKFNDSVTADTDIFASDLAPTSPPTHFRIYATFDTAGVLKVRRTYGGTTVTEQLNSGDSLTADSAYAFDIMVLEDETINIRYSAGATTLSLIVSEIREGI